MAGKASTPPDGKSDEPGFWKDLAGRVVFFWWQVLVLIAVAVAAFAAAGFAGYWLVTRHIKVEEVRVPSVLGYQVAEAVEKFHESDTNLAIQIQGRRYSDDAARGEILSQHPPGNSFAKAGAIVRVVVSQGTSRVLCPDVRGIDYLEAGIRLRDKDLAEGRKSFVHDAEVQSDQVISQSPRPGDALFRDTPVHLLVSLGPSAVEYVMPNLLGQPRVIAESRMKNIGFGRIQVSRAAFPGKADGVVFRCDPPPGAIVTRDTEIQLTIVEN